MIEITATDHSITITGHAGYAPHGQDIVCAAVSALAQTFVAAVNELTADEAELLQWPLSVEIKHGNLSRESKTLRDSFFIGCRMIAEAYPDYVRIVGIE